MLAVSRPQSEEHLRAGDLLEAAILLVEVWEPGGVVQNPVGARVVGVGSASDHYDWLALRQSTCRHAGAGECDVRRAVQELL